MSELFHLFKTFIVYLHVVFSPALVFRQENVLSFLSIYFQTNLLTND